MLRGFKWILIFIISQIVVYAVMFLNLLTTNSNLSVEYINEVFNQIVDDVGLAILASNLLVIVIMVIALIFTNKKQRISVGDYLYIKPMKNNFKIFSYISLGIIMNIVFSIVISALLPENQREVMSESNNYISAMNPFLAIFTVTLIVPLAEELIFRNFVYRSWKNKNRILAVILQALIFGIMHVTPINFAYITILSIIFVEFNDIEDSILPSMGMHIGLNLYSVLLLTINSQIATVVIISIIILGVISLLMNKKEKLV